MRAVRGLPGFRHFFGSRRGGGHGAGITSDRKDGPVGEMSDDEASSAAAAHGKKLVGDMEDEMDLDNECCICLIDMEERKFRGKMDCCDHVVCWCCIQEWAQTSRSCPICQRSYNKCKKTLPKAKKGRKHAKPNGAKGKKQRSLWEKVGGGILGRRLRSARSSPAQPEQQAPNLAAQASWGDGMGDEEADVDAGDEEVVVFPVRDSRGDDDDDDDVGAAAAAIDGAAAVAADASSSSGGSSDDSDSRRSRRSNEEEANEEGNDVIIVNIINDDSPAEQAEEEEEEEEAAVEASRVDEAVAVAVNQAGVSSSSSLATLSLSTSSVSTRDVSDEETRADNKNEEEETTTSGNNFIAEGDDRKDKGKELEEEEDEEDEEEDDDEEEEEWERKDSESDDSDDDDEDDANGPLDSY